MARPETIGKRLEFARVAAGLSTGQAALLYARHWAPAPSAGAITIFETDSDEHLLERFGGRPEGLKWALDHFAELYQVRREWLDGTAPVVELEPIAPELERLPGPQRKRLCDLFDMLGIESARICFPRGRRSDED